MTDNTQPSAQPKKKKEKTGKTAAMWIDTHGNLDLLEQLLKTDYHMTAKKACNLLSITRPTFVKYIQPNVHRIGFAGQIDPVTKTPWREELIRRGAIDPCDLSTTFFNDKEYKDLLISCCVPTRRTISVPLKPFLKKSGPEFNKFVKELVEYNHLETKTEREIQKIAIRLAFTEALDDNGKKLLKSRVEPYNRKALEAVDWPLTRDEILEADLIPPKFISPRGTRVHPELAHRTIHTEGMIRLEFNFPALDGTLSKIVRYIEDKDPWTVDLDEEFAADFPAAVPILQTRVTVPAKLAPWVQQLREWYDK